MPNKQYWRRMIKKGRIIKSILFSTCNLIVCMHTSSWLLEATSHLVSLWLHSMNQPQYYDHYRGELWFHLHRQNRIVIVQNFTWHLQQCTGFAWPLLFCSIFSFCSPIFNNFSSLHPKMIRIKSITFLQYPWQKLCRKYLHFLIIFRTKFDSFVGDW